MGVFLEAAPPRTDWSSFLCVRAGSEFDSALASGFAEDRKREGVLAAGGWLFGAAFSFVAALLAFFSGSRAVWSGGGGDFDIAT